MTLQAEESHALVPEAEALLNMIRAQGFPGWANMSIEAIRQMMAGLNPLAGESDFDGTIEDAEIPGTPPLTARRYRPRAADESCVVVYLHSGGFVAGSAKDLDGCARRLAQVTGMVVLSVDYRLAPEHKFPAGLEDAYAAVRWAAQGHRQQVSAPPRVIVGGDSAGATLAAAVCLLARERGGPRIAAQLLISPFLDGDLNSDSHRAFGGAFSTLTTRDVRFFLGHYLNHPGEVDDPRVCPMRSPDLAGLPPAVIVVGSVDGLRDDAVRYAERLQGSGVPVALRVVPGVFHGFWIAPAVLPQSAEAYVFAGESLQQMMSHAVR